MSGRIHIIKPQQPSAAKVCLPASKSISNRALIIRALCGAAFPIENLSEADDTRNLEAHLSAHSSVIDVGPAGTNFRFLAALLSVTPGEFTLTGSERLRQRPVLPLLEALRSLGAAIESAGVAGAAPLRIRGKKLPGGRLAIRGDVSSQFISALLMIAPAFENGLALEMRGKIVSAAYIRMTIAIMAHFGVEAHWQDHTITVAPQQYRSRPFAVEPDWSAASYWYQHVALSGFGETQVFLPGLGGSELQGDRILSRYYSNLGVETRLQDEGILLVKTKPVPGIFSEDLSECPDLAPAIAFTCAGLGKPFRLTGLETLNSKESVRIEAIAEGARKMGGECSTAPDAISGSGTLRLPADISFDGHDDHRMVMAAAMMANVACSVEVTDPSAVSKSYPGFWNDLEAAGFTVNPA